MRRLMTRKTAVWGAAAIAALGLAAVVKFAPVSPDSDMDSVMLDISAALGMKLDALTVEGRTMTAREDLLAALDVERGSPILSINVANARTAIEALPWVKTAKVERRLPDAVHILLEERTPYALWQREGRYTLVDRDGKAIIDVPAADQTLPLIVGPDAPAHAAALFEALGTETTLAPRVRAAVRVGGRRWNVYLDSFEGGIAIRLPEENIAAAWTRLGALEREHKILERDLDFIDMRLEDRLVVRIHKDAAAQAASPTPKKKLPVINTGTKQSI
jgi:cell division protein FtsQ